MITEAKAAGLPVVAVGAYGVSEMVDDGADGYLTGPDPVQFAGKVCHILNNKTLREEMSRRARLSAEKSSSANCTARLVDCYLKLLTR